MRQVLFAHFSSFWSENNHVFNTHKNYRCKVSTLKLGGTIALFMLNLKELIFIEVFVAHFFGGTGRKIVIKIKTLQIPGFLGKIFPVPPRISEPV